MTAKRFDTLAGILHGHLQAGLDFTLYAEGESSDFVRFGGGKVRQSGSVEQALYSVRVIDGRRHASCTVGLCGDLDIDRQRLITAADELTQTVRYVPEDPHLLLPDSVNDSVQNDDQEPTDALAVARVICAAAEGTDFVGIYAGGQQWRAFGDRRGQRNWFQAHSTLLDYSLVHGRDKGVKASVAGPQFSESALRASIESAKVQLTALDRPSRTIPPGRYRAYLAPAAVSSILGLLYQGAFSGQSQQLNVSMLNRLVSGEASLNPGVQLTEDCGSGVGPRFTSEGFVKPRSIELVVDGTSRASLVSARSALEFSLGHNGADADECPHAFTMGGGDLDPADALARLGTGVWVSNLWYLNHSDRNAARFTGMTRFATFWVEDGQLVAPLEVMRFDANLYELWGADLEALTNRPQLLPSASTYGSRSTDYTVAPGALVSALPFTI